MTTSEQKVFDVIVDFITENKYPPTVRELCQLTGYKAKSTIHYKLKSLEEQGLIETVPNGKRTIKIITPTEDVVKVVRCKDCKHYKDSTQVKGFKKCAYSSTTETDFLVMPDDFCNYGERG